MMQDSQKSWVDQQINDNELALMYESFAIISTEITDFNQQKEFISQLLNPMIEEWINPEFSNCKFFLSFILFH